MKPDQIDCDTTDIVGPQRLRSKKSRLLLGKDGRNSRLLAEVSRAEIAKVIREVMASPQSPRIR